MQPTPDKSGAALHAFIAHRFGVGDRLYGVVDAARDRELALAAQAHSPGQPRWLFKGTAGGHMADVAPYFVPIEFDKRYPYPGSGYLDLWAESLGRSAGILLIAAIAPDALWDHLRELFAVTGPDDREYYFRFYDPRVLRLFFPTCTPSEAGEFFGPIRSVLVEAEKRGEMLACKKSESGVEMDTHPLEAPGSAADQRGGRR
ncbi:MAG: DUF4123 domain-containing protein [Phycisphaerales bacterium]|nr:MAG: DUF4123 domain-containing protein [Phycisphaerales bacterium]